MPSPATKILAHHLILVGSTLQRWAAQPGRPARGTLTSRQAQLLSLLGGAPRTGELAAAVHVTPAVVTGLVDRLEEQGLVRRVPSLQDRRVIQIELTEAGRARREQVTATHQRVLAAGLAVLSGDELATVAEALALLERLVASPGSIH